MIRSFACSSASFIRHQRLSSVPTFVANVCPASAAPVASANAFPPTLSSAPVASANASPLHLRVAPISILSVRNASVTIMVKSSTKVAYAYVLSLIKFFKTIDARLVLQVQCLIPPEPNACVMVTR